MAGVVAQQIHRIDDRHHGIEAGYIRQALAVFVTEVERCGHRQRLGNAGRLDQQIVETPLARETPDLGQQIVTQRAADTAVRHLNQRFVRAAQFGIGPHQIGVDVHFRHVVDDNGDPEAVAVIQNTVEERCLAGPEKAGQHSDRQASNFDAHDLHLDLGAPLAHGGLVAFCGF